LPARFIGPTRLFQQPGYRVAQPAARTQRTPNSQKFFGSFFSKKIKNHQAVLFEKRSKTFF
jgi:hypothetical protein